VSYLNRFCLGEAQEFAPQVVAQTARLRIIKFWADENGCAYLAFEMKKGMDFLGNVLWEEPARDVIPADAALELLAALKEVPAEALT
jgi:hypothetical protein